MLGLNALARKTHRLFALTTTILSLFMLPTGMSLKYPQFFGFPGAGTARYIHNYVSPLFAISLGFMLATGIIMLIYPVVRKFSRD